LQLKRTKGGKKTDDTCGENAEENSKDLIYNTVIKVINELYQGINRRKKRNK
jgi:hypothetical protein